MGINSLVLNEFVWSKRLVVESFGFSFESYFIYFGSSYSTISLDLFKNMWIKMQSVSHYNNRNGYYYSWSNYTVPGFQWWSKVSPWYKLWKFHSLHKALTIIINLYSLKTSRCKLWSSRESSWLMKFSYIRCETVINRSQW